MAPERQTSPRDSPTSGSYADDVQAPLYVLCRARRPSAIAAPERQTSPPESPSPGSYTDDGKPPPVPKGLNKFSRTITQPKAQGASQAQLFGTGLREEDLDKPQVLSWRYKVNARCR